MLSLSICQAYEILMQLALRLPTESTDEASLSCAGTDNDREAALRQAAKQPPGAGDGRLRPFTSSYAADFHSPFPEQSKLRSPLRSKEARQPHELRGIYTSVMQRVGE